MIVIKVKMGIIFRKKISPTFSPFILGKAIKAVI